MHRQTIIIGDTHFGVRNNSMTWLKHQVEGFNEILEYMDKTSNDFDETLVIHVGDLFDSRSSINPMVYEQVNILLQETNKLLRGHGDMYILGGNHDYYYPWESENNYSSINMLPELSNIHYVIDKEMILGDFALIPWFQFHNKQTLKYILSRSPKHSIIFTHTDPIHMDPEIHEIIGRHSLITGHIHHPILNWEYGVLGTGASFPIDFTDSDSPRGFWVLNEYRQVEFHPIKSSIHFHTIMESDLNNWQNIGIKKDDYVEVQIRASRVDDYKDILKTLNENFNTTVLYLTESMDIITEATEILDVDMVCKKLLPEKLKGVYEEMTEICNKSL